ncbi:MAG: hypothetical protein KA436_11720 [Oligoflexales bacterium]|nr:hypothetical protein [Oligoflexales bacterium]
MNTLLVCSTFIIAMIIHSGVYKKSAVEQENSQLSSTLNVEIQQLKVDEEKALLMIESLAPVLYPTKRAKLVAELELVIRKELKKKSAELSSLLQQSIGRIAGEATVMEWFRYIALAWNIVLSRLLAFLLRKEFYSSSS